MVIRKLLAAMAMVGAVLVMASPAQAQYACEGFLTIAPTTASEGDEITITGQGFPPGEVVLIGPEAVFPGGQRTVTAGPGGDFQTTVTAPGPGVYEINAQYPTNTGSNDPDDPDFDGEQTLLCAPVTFEVSEVEEAEIAIDLLTPTCVADAPALQYDVQVTGVEGLGANPVTITWVNPNGPDVVQTGLPLSGTTLWPGTEIENGVTVGWPGWIETRNADGSISYEQGDDGFAWVRPQVDVIVAVNPEVTDTVDYPPPTFTCADPPEEEPEVEGSSVLPFTGSDSVTIVTLASVLVVLGGLALLASRRRHHVA